MKEVVAKQQELMDLLHHKIAANEQTERILNERTAILEQKEAAFAEKSKAFSAREEAVVGVENVQALRADNERRAAELNEASAALKHEREQFLIYTQSEQSKISHEKTVISEEWKTINKRTANIAADIEKQVKEVLAKIVK